MIARGHADWLLSFSDIRARMQVMVGPASLKMQVIDRVKLRFATPELAWRWYQTKPLPGFSGLTAAQLVEAGRGREVLEYIEAVDAGVYA
jgi:hypothetical protein